MIDPTGPGLFGAPCARTAELVVSGLDDEVLIYDVRRNKAHCLNPTAAFVWRHCDGRRSVQDLAALTADGSRQALGETVVLYALGQLADARLLEQFVPAGAPRMSRAQLLKAGAIGGAVLLPVISSITAPTAAHAASCGGQGQACSPGTCCTGFTCSVGICQPN